MAIGHAAGITANAGLPGWTAVVAIAACNLAGSLFSGWLSDRFSHRRILTILPLLGAVALLTLSVLPAQTLVFLGIVGFAYGGTIATYPAAIFHLYPGEAGPRAYGRIFTAWGCAGLLAPWFAGQIYDWNASYTPALWIAACLSILSAYTAQKYIRR
jgi:MFS family permease